MEKKLRAGVIALGITYIFIGWVESCILLNNSVLILRDLNFVHWILIFIVGIITAGPGISVLFFKKWSRFLILTISTLRLIRGLLMVFVILIHIQTNTGHFKGYFHWPMILPIIEFCYIYFFTRPNVKKLFNQEKQNGSISKE